MKLKLLFIVLIVSAPTVAQSRRPRQAQCFKSSIPGIGQLNLEESFGNRVFTALLKQTLNKDRDLRNKLSSAFCEFPKPNYKTVSFDIQIYETLKKQLPSNNEIDSKVLLNFCNAFKSVGYGSGCIVQNPDKDGKAHPTDKCPCPRGNIL